MRIYEILVNGYDQFLSLFPEPIHWLVTLAVLIGLVVAFVNLIRYHWLFILLLIILLPVIFPILQRFFTDLFQFFLYLLEVLQSQPPAS